ncbi:hypothetical protein CPS_0545 [Colwellia psychrerythraea 34H]|uniref:Uncharacterized protein n=1 Tax=Colwellia psychrerythraea (strain 34H / ATCC BAA-681) TaxID=167879 RepID=Q489G1_COLP3|nr:hypothetical protein CPS_0545 [Colwellia psychrerythraea 34H]
MHKNSSIEYIPVTIEYAFSRVLDMFQLKAL